MTCDKRGSDSLSISPAEAFERVGRGATLVDIRGPGERALGWAHGSIPLRDDESVFGLPERSLLVICARGKRSSDFVAKLRSGGHRDSFSVEGGFAAWRAEGLPVEFPAGLDDERVERYARQLVLPELGPEGQQRLGDARVTLVGAGGLGSPAALYLAAAGVGSLKIIDDDVVTKSNLHRQVLHGEAGLGEAKVNSAQQRLGDLNPDVMVEPIAQRLASGNIEALLRGSDVVLDGSDNFPTRYLVNDACVHLGLPLVYGAVLRFEGQVSVFHPAAKRGVNPCYRCLFPLPPAAADAPDCSTAGVIGVLPGLIGVLQATEVIKLILGLGDSLVGRLLRFDAMGMRFRESMITADPACAYCAPGLAFPGYVDYESFCAG